jgi:hypothetical protein
MLPSKGRGDRKDPTARATVGSSVPDDRIGERWLAPRHRDGEAQTLVVTLGP